MNDIAAQINEYDGVPDFVRDTAIVWVTWLMNNGATADSIAISAPDPGAQLNVVYTALKTTVAMNFSATFPT